MPEPNNSGQSEGNDDIEDNVDKFKQRKWKESSPPNPAVMYNIDGQKISPSEIVSIACGEDQFLVFFTLESNQEALAFPKDYSTRRNHFNDEREVPITPSKYVQDRSLVTIDLQVVVNTYFILLMDFEF